jgi:hypothetical protein
MGAATEKDKVINIQGQERKIDASWRLMSLEKRRPSSGGQCRKSVPWFRFSARVARLGCASRPRSYSKLARQQLTTSSSSTSIEHIGIYGTKRT